MPPLPIRIKNNGPLFITVEDAARLELTDHTGAPIAIPPSAKGVSLCRCGASKRKPFCDASHKLIGFDGTLASPVPAPPAADPAPPSPSPPASDPGTVTGS